MNSDQFPDEAVRRRETGRVSLALGVAAVAMYGCPLLSFLPPWIRLIPMYLILPLGVCAIVFGGVDLFAMRGTEGADRRLARAGVALGTISLAVPIVLLVWLEWSLSR
ncbi:hypothetical protein AB0D83_05180 [Streptomyces decoyicus]|uniref:hypothetical protein n=1 Tax=Streptomyces decoyicus TaxID=249567 RepID=UPI00340827AF